MNSVYSFPFTFSALIESGEDGELEVKANHTQKHQILGGVQSNISVRDLSLVLSPVCVRS